MPHPIVISHFQTEPVLRARREGRSTATTSLDLGLSTAEVEVWAVGVLLPDGQVLGWQAIEAVARSATACFVVEDGGVRPIQVFSEYTNWPRALMPTAGAPTMLVSGVLMHRVKGTDPYRDTLTKIRAAAPVTGRVLDTATGLGYTAIEAAKTAEHVVTIELDPAGLEVARLNPWSRGLFDNPKIEQRVGDSFEEVQALPDGRLTCIIHDPPAFALAGELYSGEFYRHLHRILTPRGRVFHYIGDPDSAFGRKVTPGIIRRLQEAGFTRVVRRPEAFGVTAFK